MYKVKYLLLLVIFAFVVSGCNSVKPDIGQAVFTSGEEACTALIDAAKKNDTKRLMQIFGPQGKDIVFSGDDNLDAETRAYFAKTAEDNFQIEGIEDESYIMEFGDDDFPFAIPLAKYDGKWFFNTPEGLDELINRRIGRNEIFTINVCEALAKTEVEYARMRIVVDGVREYAMKFLNETGKFNSLYWNPETGKKENLICSDLALAALEPGNEKRQPYYGYYYKVLKSQGPDAPGGRKNYLVDGKLKKGFAVLAYPSRYGDLGIKSFMVSKNGIIFEKDLGDDTEKKALAITEYNPDDTWDPVRN
jgi:hypothetical protein